MTRLATAFALSIALHVLLFALIGSSFNADSKNDSPPILDSGTLEISLGDEGELPASQSSPLPLPASEPVPSPQDLQFAQRHPDLQDFENPPPLPPNPSNIPGNPALPEPPKVSEPISPPESAEASRPTQVSPPAQKRMQVKYPSSSRRRGEAGTVVVEAEVNSLGKVTRAVVAESSGYEALDREALRAMREAHFSPATRDGEPVEGKVRLPVVFRLRD